MQAFPVETPAEDKGVRMILKFLMTSHGSGVAEHLDGKVPKSRLQAPATWPESSGGHRELLKFR
jgi:hypothetical protein